MDKGTWRATVHGSAKSQTRLTDQHTHTNTCDIHPIILQSDIY